MPQFSIRTVTLALTAGLSLAACDTYGYGGLGYGGGYGYNGYGSGIAVGVSGSPYWGWNDGYYYPGTGYYVYDSYRRPYRWNQAQQTYWIGRQSSWSGNRQFRQNWGDFRRDRRR